jgi:P27 family predicted phage terminase small subunit
MIEHPDKKSLRLLRNDKAHAHRYKNNSDVEPSSERPVAPEYLSERAKEIFNDFVERIEDIAPASKTDLDIIVLYANNKEQLESYELYLRENGSTYEYHTVHSTSVKPRPEITMLKDCKTLQYQILKEFGLSPSSRSKVKVKPKEVKKENPFAAVGKQKQG